MSLLEAAISWIAPPECISCGSEGSSLCIDCSGRLLPYGNRCWNCGSLTENGRTCPRCRHTGSPSHVWITTNHESLARDLLHNFKFEQNRAAADSISRLMLETNRNYSSEDGLDYLVVPIPTATKRVRERGFDHSALLAKKIAQELRLEYRSVLARLGQTRQVGAKRSDRLKQMDSKFRVKRSASVLGRKILLIDDVVTTGSTLNAVSKTLHKAGATQVDALVFAKRL